MVYLTAPFLPPPDSGHPLLNTELLDYLKTRRSVPAPALVPPAPDRRTLRDILEIAVRVPDHGKLAPWRFLVLEGDVRAAFGERLAEIVATRDGVADEERLRLERERFVRAPLVVCLISTAAPHPKIPVWEQQLSAGCVGLNLLHALAAHGFAAQWITEWYAYDEDARPLFGLAAHEKIAGFVHIGTASERPTDRARPDVDALIRYAEPPR